MIQWVDNKLFTSQMAEKGSMRLVAEITEAEGKYRCKLDWEPLNYHAEEMFDNLDFAKRWAEAYPHEKICKECNKLHEVIAFCELCGACLYEHGRSLNDEMYPLFECEKCGQVNFWD